MANWVVWTIDDGVLIEADKYAQCQEYVRKLISHPQPFKLIRAGLHSASAAGKTYYVSTKRIAYQEGIISKG